MTARQGFVGSRTCRLAGVDERAYDGDGRSCIIKPQRKKCGAECSFYTAFFGTPSFGGSLRQCPSRGDSDYAPLSCCAWHSPLTGTLGASLNRVVAERAHPPHTRLQDREASVILDRSPHHQPRWYKEDVRSYVWLSARSNPRVRTTMSRNKHGNTGTGSVDPGHST